MLERALAPVPVSALAPPCAPPPVADPLLCDWVAFDDRRRSANVMPDATQQHFEHMRSYTPPPSFQAWDEARTAAAIDAIATDPLILKYAGQVKKQSRYNDHDEAAQQADIRQKLLQRTADLLRAAYDLPPIPVTLERLDGDMRYSIAGFYMPHAPKIVINYEIQAGITDSYVEMLDTILHEARHSIAADMAYMLLNGEIDRDDVRAPFAAAILLNSKEYISSDRADHVDTGFTIFGNAYSLQYSERDAFAYGRAVTARLTARMNCQTMGWDCLRAQAQRLSPL